MLRLWAGRALLLNLHAPQLEREISGLYRHQSDAAARLRGSQRQCDDAAAALQAAILELQRQGQEPHAARTAQLLKQVGGAPC